MFELEFYETSTGRVPIQEFLDALPIAQRAKAIRSLELLQEYGNELREPYSKPIFEGLFELRIKFASDISRIFYFFLIGHKIIATNGFVKKTSTTPVKEIKRALRYKHDYERRHQS